MRRILFCNIAYMKYYKGTDGDEPVNGGAYVKENKDAHEAYNFEPITFEGDEIEYCLGFVETKSTNGKNRNQLHIERIADGNENEEEIDDVLVIWCAKSDCADFTSVVGWYKHATVYREYECAVFGEYEQSYNVIAKAKDCVLLPTGIRHRRTLWYVPRTGKKSGPSYGFGQANIWFPNTESENNSLSEYINKILNQIDNYNGDNWLYEKK